MVRAQETEAPSTTKVLKKKKRSVETTETQDSVAPKMKKKKSGDKKSEGTMEIPSQTKVRKGNDQGSGDLVQDRKKKRVGAKGAAPAEDPAPPQEKPSFNREFRVFISGIPKDFDEAVVRKDFEECGTVVNCKLLTDKETGQSKGLAFVSFEDEAGLQAALAYDGDDYGGQRLRVKKAEAKGNGKGNGAADMGEKPEGCNSVVLRRLSPEVTEADIKKLFKKSGRGPISVGLLTDRATGKSRCTARVDFAHDDSEGVDQAVALNGTELKGRPVVMGYCKPRDW
eukprot:TRINITY_DN40562_c0_g1_i1.p1 TRINITY_DN40562_c0_g1~~TRINITY_DN40562_c0_g1_i1.p1  ORF type:complete len:283 (+),score=50.23 TRINITY_DN40562_c0_g1_i1:52-900(+)